MKPCPSCAEPLDDDVNMGHRCHNGAGPQQAGRRPADRAPVHVGHQAVRLSAAVGVLVTVGCCLAYVAVRHSHAAPPRTRALNVAAARSAIGVSITNHEAAVLRHCSFTVTIDAHGVWVARVERDVRPMETIDLRWAEFRSADDHPMPNYLNSRGIAARRDVGHTAGLLEAGLW